MALLRPLDVLWIPDETIRPPGPKMVACIVPDEGWFYRINSKGVWKPNVPLMRLPDHPFLKWDSFLECGDPLELDDYVVEESLARGGVIGRISDLLRDSIVEAAESSPTLRTADKALIRKTLGTVPPQPR